MVAQMTDIGKANTVMVSKCIKEGVSLRFGLNSGSSSDIGSIFDTDTGLGDLTMM